jgi:hypothetical protein
MIKNQKLERWAKKEIIRNLAHLIVADAAPGTYIVFGNFIMEPTAHGYSISTKQQQIHVFGNKRTAISWCVATKYNQHALADEIKVLDNKCTALANDIHCRKTVGLHSRNQDFYEMVATKIQPKLARYDSINTELEKCINRAKYLQIRGFNNETV